MQGDRCCRQQETMGCRIGSVASSFQECVTDRTRPDKTSPFCAFSNTDRPHAESIELGIGTLHVMEVARHCKVICTRGTVWVTGGNRLSDYILKAGESLLLRGQLKVIVSGGRNDCVVWICRD
jgi:hypothetical protein